MNKLTSKSLVEAHKLRLSLAFSTLRQNGMVPHLAAVVCSSDPAVLSYVGSKNKLAREIGVEFEVVHLSPTENKSSLKTAIRELAERQEVCGIVLELPVANGIDEIELTNSIPATKDVDGLSFSNLGRLAQWNFGNTIQPATPLACIELAKTRIELSGANAVVVGRGRTVGRPLAEILVALGATTTICNSKTNDLPSITRRADVVFTATGNPNKFGNQYFRSGQLVIDAGIGFIDGRLVGDVNIAETEHLDITVTPVPGGVGPLTAIHLFGNLLKAMEIANDGPHA